jgi:membrane-bound ClpP family serine protease
VAEKKGKVKKKNEKKVSKKVDLTKEEITLKTMIEYYAQDNSNKGVLD